MDGGWAILLCCERKLPAETLELGWDVRVIDPSIKADFTDGGVRKFSKEFLKPHLPMSRTIFDIPRVQGLSQG